MRNPRASLIVGALLLAPLAAHAAQITEEFTITVNPAAPLSGGPVNFPGTSFAQFNPANGTLNSFSTTLSGPATWTSTSFFAVALAALVLHSSGEAVAPAQFFSSPGAINIGISGTDSFAPDFPGLIGTGTAVLDLQVAADSGGTFATSASGLQGTITYNYTPAAVPEPASLVLLGAGLLGLAVLAQRNAA